MSAKSKKKGEKILMLPGAMGWEAWTGSNGGGMTLSVRTGEQRALDVGGLPGGELTMAFPVRDVSALPFLAPTTDEALFHDLADMHVERLGMRPLVNAGVLSDCFRVGSRGNNSLLLPVILAPPPEGHLPRRSPQTFDISARCLPLPSNGVVIWRELGRWVFAVADDGQPIHFQSLAATKLGEDAGREIRISLSQLQIQGLLVSSPKHCFIWVGEEESRPAPPELEALEKGFGGSTMVAEKPAPVMPARPSHLLPADVRAERLAKRQKQQARLGVAVAGLVYLGLIGWAGWTLLEAKRDAAGAKKVYDEIAPEVAGLDAHIRKWDELQPLVELEHWPVELMLSSSKARPDQGLRLDSAEIINQLKVGDGAAMELQRSIVLDGKADELDQVNTFNVNLKASDALRSYRWDAPSAVLDQKTGRWQFRYTGTFTP